MTLVFTGNSLTVVLRSHKPCNMSERNLKSPFRSSLTQEQSSAKSCYIFTVYKNTRVLLNSNQSCVNVTGSLNNNMQAYMCVCTRSLARLCVNVHTASSFLVTCYLSMCALQQFIIGTFGIPPEAGSLSGPLSFSLLLLRALLTLRL
jgi:hypothetical protein